MITTDIPRQEPGISVVIMETGPLAWRRAAAGAGLAGQGVPKIYRTTP
jgi:hypothetical protein